MSIDIEDQMLLMMGRIEGKLDALYHRYDEQSRVFSAHVVSDHEAQNRIEERIRELERVRWYHAGIIVAVSFVAQAAWRLL